MGREGWVIGLDKMAEMVDKAEANAKGSREQKLQAVSDRFYRGDIAADLESTFAFLFAQLNVNGTAELVRRTVEAPIQHHSALKPALVAAEDDPDAGE